MKNLYNALVNDSKSVFYATNKITKNLMKKAKVIVSKGYCYHKHLK